MVASDLIVAIRTGDVNAVRGAIDAAPSLARSRDSDGVSVVCLAVYAGQGEIARVLTSGRDDLDLFEASTVGDLDRVGQLLAAGPEVVGEYSPDGFHALGYACFFGRQELVELLPLFRELSSAALAALLLAGCDLLERPQRSYPSYSEARAQGAVGPGKWLPELLPESATDIREQHDLDTNESWLSFSFTPGELDQPPGCRPTTSSKLATTRTPRWWRRAADEVRTGRRLHECVRRTELAGYWAESRCLLIVSGSSAVHGCEASKLAP